MSDGSLKTLAMLALIIGAAGVGFGIFATWQVQRGGADGEDGDVGDDGITTTIITYDNVIEYPCSSEADINNALTAIGTGYGIITITTNITLSGTINIDDGGNYIIQSAGAIIKCANNNHAIHITSARSLTIQNLKIDATALIASRVMIYIQENSNNKIYIKNVQIIGDSNVKGLATGIYIDSDNVWISECYFHKVKFAVLTGLDEQNAHICNNEIDNWGVEALSIMGVYNLIDGNLMKNGLIGIYSDWDSYNNIISNNIIYNFSGDAIRLYSDYSTVVGNNIANNSKTTDPYGINVEGSYNTIGSNSLYNIKGATGNSIGISIASATYNNTVVGNTCLFCDDAFYDDGNYTYESGNQFF